MRDYDRVDGERLFSPRLINKSMRKRDKPIEDHLLAYKKYYKDNREHKLKDTIRKEKEEARLNLCENSNQILARSFVNNLTMMFKLLDKNNNE